jgi:hypothetical protein
LQSLLQMSFGSARLVRGGEALPVETVFVESGGVL